MNNILLNPFEKHSDQKLLIIGAFSILVGATLGSFFNARFDGVFDLHFVEKATFLSSLTDILISVLSACLLLFLTGKYANPKTRLIDIFNTCSIAKIPFYVLTVFNINDWIYHGSIQLVESVLKHKPEALDMSQLIPILLFSLVTLLALVLAVILLYNGYKVATNAKGIKNTVLFVAALLIAEVVSKMILSTLN
ncbi:hypothetical protein [Flavobacterium sp.]|uniref:hypothetical protein n=1 Tax=Flavobacterium sp. TaxID=239 RepID=UPI002622E562|nr:hypothetical protein [Flavobacterium sp.]